MFVPYKSNFWFPDLIISATPTTELLTVISLAAKNVRFPVPVNALPELGVKVIVPLDAETVAPPSTVIVLE